MKRLASVVILLLSSQAYALDCGTALRSAEADVEGTFVVYDVSAERLVAYDRMRANTRLSPVSAFKIRNTLIGLSAEAARRLSFAVTPFTATGGNRYEKASHNKASHSDSFSVAAAPPLQAARVGSVSS